MTTTPHLALPLIAAAQAQKHVTHNEALLAIDALLHCAVKDKDLAAPPAAPAEGDRYIVAVSPTDAWAGKAGQVATRQDGAWRFYAPKAGWIAFVVDEAQLYRFDGAAWVPGVAAITTLQNLALLGLGTTADAANPFSTRLNAVLHTAKTVAEGGTGDVRVKLSKESTAKTASFLFQTNFSGRAELGLAGDDSFHIKTSADGTAWIDALVLAPGTGAATFAAGASFGGAVAMTAAADQSLTIKSSTGNRATLGVFQGLAEFGINREIHTGVFADAGKAHAGVRLMSANGASTILFRTASANNVEGTDRLRITAAGVTEPCADNAYTLGSSSFRWSQLYAGTTTINTSDAEEKTGFRAPDAAVLLAALDTEQGFYRWTDSVERKGERARWHFGPTAQGFAKACWARGVDPRRLAVYCEDPVLVPVRKRRTVDGVEQESEELEPTGRTRYGLRLDQFDRLLQEARWRVLNGTLAHAPPSA